MTSGSPAPAAPLTAGQLQALDADTWAGLLPLIRAALHELDDGELTPQLQRLRAAPTGRLAGGRSRQELCHLLATQPPLWQRVVDQAAARQHPSLPWLRGDKPPPLAEPSPTPSPDAQQDRDQDRRRAASQPGQGKREQRERMKRLREERDVARRRLEGAEARAQTLEAEVSRLEAALQRAQSDLAAAEDRLRAAAEERRQAVQRESRRRDREVAQLRDELAALRRAEAERQRREQERARAAERAREQATRRQREQSERDQQRGTRAVPGRPSRLPAGVAPDTVEAVQLLLNPGRLVLVDGYNVTLRHRDDLTLEEQRNWLVQQLAALARRRQVRPVVVFDGERTGGRRSRLGARDVEVRFTAPGITADDELVLAVEGTDEPVVVVTDDRELRARLAISGADVVRTAPFVAAL